MSLLSLLLTPPPPRDVKKRGSVAIIGAGLGGLTAALALMRSGWHVRVYEQTARLGEAGAGISLAPGAGRALTSLGVGSALLARSSPVPDVAFVDYRTGKLLAGRFDNGTRPDGGFETARHIHRADLHSVLLDAVQIGDPAVLLIAHRLVAVEEGDGGVTARFTNGSIASADMLVAADGVRSAVREQLFGSGAPEFAGQRIPLSGPSRSGCTLHGCWQCGRVDRPWPHLPSLHAAPRPARRRDRDQPRRSVD